MLRLAGRRVCSLLFEALIGGVVSNLLRVTKVLNAVALSVCVD